MIIDIVNDHLLTQLQQEATRSSNMLDLYFIVQKPGLLDLCLRSRHYFSWYWRQTILYQEKAMIYKYIL